MSPKALSGRPYGQFHADIRLCRGRKGFPHVGTEDLNQVEIGIVRSRLLGAVRAALEEGVLTREDLAALLGTPSSVSIQQLAFPSSVGEAVRSVRGAGESVRTSASESIRARAREEK